MTHPRVACLLVLTTTFAQLPLPAQQGADILELQTIAIRAINPKQGTTGFRVVFDANGQGRTRPELETTNLARAIDLPLANATESMKCTASGDCTALPIRTVVVDVSTPSVAGQLATVTVRRLWRVQGDSGESSTGGAYYTVSLKKKDGVWVVWGLGSSAR